MTLSYPVVKAIFDTLPIGYYLGRAIDCELSADGTASYFNVASDKIVISYPMIASAATELPTTVSNDEVEKLIRGLLYHEVSHVILTPKDLRVTTALNIFEDERIESICKNLYMNTNFFDNLIKLNHFNGEAPTTADAAFYQLVRFHIGTPEWLKRCRNLLNEYSYLNCTSYSGDYAYDVNEFYKDFVKWYNEEAKKDASNSESEESEEGTENETSNSGSETKPMTEEFESENEETEKTSDSSNKSTTSKPSKNEPNGSSEETKTSSSSMNEEDSEESTNTSTTPAHGTKPSDMDDMSIDLEAFKGIINESINKYYNATLISNLTNIITKAMKKNKRNGSAINSYSGRLHVKSVVRDDYRWWVQENRAGHVRQNSKVHFNLFIDNSGSFRYNDDAMNEFIKALDKVEKSTPNFTFDVITINTKVVEWDTHNQIFESCGGNKLLPSIKEVIKKHTLPQTTNYNIVLFDGDAHSDDDWGWGRATASPDPFKFFNLPNTIIISDHDNQGYIEAAHVTQAKVRYTNNYCHEFISIICNLLEKTL